MIITAESARDAVTDSVICSSSSNMSSSLTVSSMQEGALLMSVTSSEDRVKSDRAATREE